MVDPFVLICLILFFFFLFDKFNFVDLYDGLNTNITIWMILIPKITIFSLLLLLSVEHSTCFAFPNWSNSYYNFFILIAGILSIFIGSIALTQQYKIKRFFAYSGISHVGFILLALYNYDFHSYLIYLFIYVLTTLNIFSILIAISKYQGKDINFINKLIGLFQYNPFLSFVLAINLFSLAGRYVCFIFYILLVFFISMSISLQRLKNRTIIY